MKHLIGKHGAVGILTKQGLVCTECGEKIKEKKTNTMISFADLKTDNTPKFLKHKHIWNWHENYGWRWKECRLCDRVESMKRIADAPLGRVRTASTSGTTLAYFDGTNVFYSQKPKDMAWLKLRKELLELAKELEDRNGLPYCKNCGMDYRELVRRIGRMVK